MPGVARPQGPIVAQPVKVTNPDGSTYLTYPSLNGSGQTVVISDIPTNSNNSQIPLGEQNSSTGQPTLSRPTAAASSASGSGSTLNSGIDPSNSGTAAPIPENKPTFAFEQVAVRLQPFDLATLAAPQPGTAMEPIAKTQGLVFPYNPVIREGIRVKYDNIELTHTNESYYSYRGTDNVRIRITDAVWTCDTFDNAVYALAALHFFRRYRLMDFGQTRPARLHQPTGRPPRPMWLHGYGNYAFYRCPVLMEKADWAWPNDVDYVGIPEFGRAEYVAGSLASRKTARSGPYTWMPMVFKVNRIQLIVQHSPRYWLNFSLDDYRSGYMVRQRKRFHDVVMAGSSGSSSAGGANRVLSTLGGNTSASALGGNLTRGITSVVTGRNPGADAALLKQQAADFVNTPTFSQRTLDIQKTTGLNVTN